MSNKREPDDDSRNLPDIVTIPARFVYWLIPAAFLGGGGVVGTLQPGLETQVISECVASNTDLNNRLNALGTRTDAISARLEQLASITYTDAEAERDRQRQEHRDHTQDRTLEVLEARIERRRP